MTTPREDHSATLLADGRVLLAGGHDFHNGSSTVEASAELYDANANTFSRTGSMGSPREGQTATLLSSGLVLVAGGANSNTTATQTAELYDPKAGTFRPTGSMSTPREDASATLLADGRVLMVGGVKGPTLNGAALDSAEIYDPTTGTFKPTRTMSSPRTGLTTTLLPDGRVVIIGGRDDVAPIAWAELFDPQTGIFSISGSMSLPRFGHVAVTLPDGRILVAGGDRSVGAGSLTYLASAELFDPQTGAFVPTGSLALARLLPTAATIASGRVLVIGGWVATDTTSRAAATVESYDPVKGTFSVVTPPGTSVLGPLLPTGWTVLPD